MVGRSRGGRSRELADARKTRSISATHYDAHPEPLADRAYDDVRGAYYLGQIASHNPNFRARQFEEVEPRARGRLGVIRRSVRQLDDRAPLRPRGILARQSKLDDAARRARAEHEGRTPGERGEERP